MSKRIQEAQNLLEQGYIDRAQQLLAQVVQEAATDKERGEAAFQYGKLQLMGGDLKRALELCRQAVECLPEDPRTHYYLGQVYRQQEQWNAAIEAFARADELQPNDPAILANRGTALFYLSGGKEGKSLLIKALRLDFGRHETLLDLALVYATEEDFVAAMTCAMQAHQLNPGDETTAKVIDTIQRLRRRFDDGAESTTIRRSLPRSREEWRRWIGTVSSPMELLSSLTDHTPPESEQDLQALAERAFAEWNRCPRPELGGLSPEQASKKKSRPSKVEDSRTYPWLQLDNRLAEENPVRRDMVAFLSHLGETTYKATASLGNLPLKGVRAVNDLLTHPVSLENKNGDEVISKVRLVSDVWEIFFLQGIAMMNELAVFEPGKRITLTDAGHDFLESSPDRQLWSILDTWWWKADWSIAYDWELFEDFGQSGLPFITLRLLRNVPTGKRIKVDDFLQVLSDMLSAQMIAVNPIVFKPAMRFMILNILEDFEIVTLKKKPKKLHGIRLEEVIWFKITPFGYQLLQTI